MRCGECNAFHMYKEYHPSAPLSPYIDKYWEFKGHPEYGMRINILPDGCTDFIFTLGEVANAVDGSLVMQPYRAYFVGAMTRYSELVTYADTVHMLGIRFLPCGILRFMNLPLHELSNLRISTEDIESPFGHSFAERLCEQENIRAQICFIEEFLIKLMHQCTPKAEEAMLFAVKQINLHNGNLSLHQLADETCMCQRHFERKFKWHTGYTPKEYSRIMKFKYTVDLLRGTSYDNLLSVAIKAGYYDVPHLSKEIKKMSGNTPTHFLASPPPEDGTLTYVKP